MRQPSDFSMLLDIGFFLNISKFRTKQTWKNWKDKKLKIFKLLARERERNCWENLKIEHHLLDHIIYWTILTVNPNNKGPMATMIVHKISVASLPLDIAKAPRLLLPFSGIDFCRIGRIGCLAPSMSFSKFFPYFIILAKSSEMSRHPKINTEKNELMKMGRLECQKAELYTWEFKN